MAFSSTESTVSALEVSRSNRICDPQPHRWTFPACCPLRDVECNETSERRAADVRYVAEVENQFLRPLSKEFECSGAQVLHIVCHQQLLPQPMYTRQAAMSSVELDPLKSRPRARAIDALVIFWQEMRLAQKHLTLILEMSDHIPRGHFILEQSEDG